MTNFISAFTEPIMGALPKIPTVIMTFIIGYIILIILRSVLRGSLKVGRAPRALTQMVVSISSFFLWVLLFAAILYSLGLGQIALALSGSVAIIGIAVGTGANTLITDLIAGLFLARDPDFNCGYTIRVNEIEGTIEKIDLRKIRIRDKDGKLHVVPNSTFDKSAWKVLDETSR